MRPAPRCWIVLLACAAACGGSKGSAVCGIASLTVPLGVTEAFGKGLSLTKPPGSAPGAIPIRVVAGPVYRGAVTVTDSGWDIHALGDAPVFSGPGYGVLLVSDKDESQGVMVFNGTAPLGSYIIGSLQVVDNHMPLFGIRMDVKAVEAPKCPTFPDSLR
jgi:hypothetical protein